jgi:hypothetical protein
VRHAASIFHHHLQNCHAKLKCRASSYVCNFANGSKGKFIKLVPLQILVEQCPRGPLLVQGNIQLHLIGELANLPIEQATLERGFQIS